MINREDYYLEVAKLKEENKLLDAHWEECAKSREWIDINGVVTKFEELDDVHLTNIIAMLTRFYQNRQSKHIKALVCALVKELLSRVKAIYENTKE